MEEQIKSLRLEVDKLINSTNRLNPSREVSLCHTQLQRSKAWLGMVLGEIGTQTPYPESSKPESPVIEPQSEHDFQTIWNGPAMLEHTQTAHVKFFRQEIEKYLTKIKEDRIEDMASKISGKAFSYACISTEAMIEAKHWLGWELDRIRKSKEWAEKEPVVVEMAEVQLMPL